MVETIRPASHSSGSAFRRPPRPAIAYRPAGAEEQAEPRRDRRSEARYFADVASAPFLAQLAALYLGDAHAGERRIARDPSLILERADATYRSVGRLTSSIEAGFLGEVSY